MAARPNFAHKDNVRALLGPELRVDWGEAVPEAGLRHADICGPSKWYNNGREQGFIHVGRGMTRTARFRRDRCPFAASVLLVMASAVVWPVLAAAQTSVTFSRTVLSGNTYTPGGTVDVEVTLSYSGPDPVVQLGLTEFIPAGWTFRRILAGNAPEVTPQQGDTGRLDFAYIFIPPSPVTFSYRLGVDENSTGDKSITGNGIYATGGLPQNTAPQTSTLQQSQGGGEGEGEGEIEGEQPPELTLLRSPLGGANYAPGQTIQLRVTIAYGGTEPVTALALNEILPPGWTYEGIASGNAPPIQPPNGSTGQLDFAWITVPPFPVSFVYNVLVPPDAGGVQTVTGTAFYRTSGDETPSNTAVTELLPFTPPDLVVESVAPQSELWAGQTATIAWKIRNTGQLPAAGPWIDCLVLSEDTQLGSDIALTCATRNAALAPGGAYWNTALVTIPADSTAGDYFLLLNTDTGNTLAENLEDNNLGVLGPIHVGVIDYTATVSADITAAPAGSTVTLSGQANLLNAGAPAAGVPVSVDIFLRGTRRTLHVITDAAGSFTAPLQNAPTEAGIFAIAARHPGAAPEAAEDTFTLFGIAARPARADVQIAPGAAKSLKFRVMNLSNAPQTGLNAAVVGAPPQINASVSLPPALASDGTVTLALDLSASAGAPPTANLSIQIATNEGAEASIPLSLEVLPEQVILEPVEVPLSAGAVPGHQTLYRFELRNAGGLTAENLRITPPTAAWATVVAPISATALAPEDVLPVTLQLAPPIDTPLGSINDNIEVSFDGGSLTLPLTLASVSGNTGGLQISVRDEIGPVPDAPIALRDPVTDALEASGTTDSAGQLALDNLPRGEYILAVRPLEHGEYRATARVETGVTRAITARVARDTTRVLWNFAPEIGDSSYVFEASRLTNPLPGMPVLTLEPAAIDLRYFAAAAADIPLTIRNEGTVPAENAVLALGAHPRFQLGAAITQLGTLAPGAAVTVTVHVQDLGPQAAQCDLAATSGVEFTWDSDKLTHRRRAPLALLLPLNLCPAALPQYGELRGQDSDLAPVYVTPPLFQLQANCPAPLPGPGVFGNDCSAASLQLNTRSVIAGEKIQVLLELHAGAEAWQSLGVTLAVFDASGANVSNRFSLPAPSLEGISSLNGAGSLAPGALARARYRISPLPSAAPAAASVYFLGGTLSDNRGTRPLVPLRFVVLPPSLLESDFFLPAVVYGDDPATPALEAPEPFKIGIIAQNIGQRTLDDLLLSRATPLYRQRDSNAVARYVLSEARQDGIALPLMLRAPIGQLQPGAHSTVVFSLQSPTAANRFSAEDIYRVGGPERGIIPLEAIAGNVHDLVRVVNMDHPADDGIEDFLVNDVPDSLGLPDTLYGSDGAVLPVEDAADAVLTPAKQDELVFTLQGSAGNAWAYFRASVNIAESFVLSSVVRSDGKRISPSNAWYTRRIARTAANQPIIQNHVHILDFDSTGIYTVTFGDTANRPPIANAGGDQQGFIGVPVTLSAAASTDPDGDPLGYAWTLLSRPAGSTAVLDNPAAIAPGFTPDLRGDYVVRLIVNDGQADSAPVTITVRIINRAPTANAGADFSHPIRSTATLSAAGSTDLDGDPLSFAWSFAARPAGSTALINNATTANPSFTPDRPGTYVLQLIVNDGFANSAPDTVTITATNAPPIASISAPSSAPAGATVALSAANSSDPEGAPLSYQWSLAARPAGSTAAISNPAQLNTGFTPDRRGSYTVQLVVNDGFVNSAPVSAVVQATNAAPVANAGPDQNASVGSTVTLNGSASSDANGDTLSYLWSFVSRPGGSTAALDGSNTIAPTFLVDAPGQYVVQLIVNDGTENSAPDTVIISTINRPPVANAGPDRNAAVGETVQLDGAASTDPDGNALSFNWTFLSRPDGSTAAIDNPAVPGPSFVPDRKGSYTLQLVVSDGTLSSIPDQVVVNVLNRPPIANAGPDQSVALGATVQLDGGASADPDGDAITFTWTIITRPAGSVATLANPNTATPSFVMDRRGEFIVRLVVNDGTANSAPDTVSVTPRNSAPIANAGPDRSGRVGETITLSGAASSDPDGDTLSFAWSFLSRPAGSTATLQNAGAVNPSFTIDLPGNYLLQLIVNDGNLSSTPATVTVSTTNAAPIANAGAPQTRRVGDRVNLDGSASSDPDGNPLSYAWSFSARPAGSTATLQGANTVAPFFTIDAAGNYLVQLVVNDGTVNSAPATVSISTENSAPIADAGPDQAAQLNATITLDGSGSSDPDGDPLTYAWSFVSRPTGSSAVLNNPAAVRPSFDVDRPGTYVVQLIVNDGARNSAPDTATISTVNAPPIARAGQDLTRLVGQLVTLDGSGSSDPEGAPLSYAWAFVSRPTGSTVALSSPSSPTPSFRIDLPGDYVVSLTVSDGVLSSAPDTVTVSTSNSRPTANAGPDLSAQVGTLARFDGRASNDPDGEELTFSWRILSAPVGSVALLIGPNQPQPSLTPDIAGQYIVQLTVSDGSLTSTPDSATLTATEAPPQCIPPAAPSDVSASDGVFADRIVVAWNAVPGAAQYRVFRSTENNPDTAQPVSNWLNTTEFSDASAAPASITPASGCGGSPTITLNYYFYFVRARAAADCEGSIGTGDRGHRAAADAKAAAAETPLIVPALPAAAIDPFTRVAHPNDALHVRLHAEEPIAEIWGLLEGPDIARHRPAWHSNDPESNTDGWAVFRPDNAWPIGVTITVTAGASTVSGHHIGPFNYDFVIVAEETSAGVSQFEATERHIPALPGAIGPIYRIAPETLFAVPQHIALPLPGNKAATLYYFHDDGLGGAWYPAAQVLGWTLPETHSLLWDKGQYWYTIALRHGGLVQLGPVPTPAIHPASLFPAAHVGDLVAGAVLLLTLLLSRRIFVFPR